MKNKSLPYWITLIVLAAAALGLQVWTLLTWSPLEGWPHRGFHPGMAFGVWPLLLVAGFFLWKRRGPHRDALSALAVEYAQGRIDREEYLARKAVLEESA